MYVRTVVEQLDANAGCKLCGQRLILKGAAGYAVSGEDCRTSAPGLFVAGDCRTKAVRQLTTAAADGTVAALAACEYLGGF